MSELYKYVYTPIIVQMLTGWLRLAPHARAAVIWVARLGVGVSLGLSEGHMLSKIFLDQITFIFLAHLE